MNVATITIQACPQGEGRSYLHAHVAHSKGERAWHGNYQGSSLRASLAGVWLALRELDNAKQYKCIVNLKINQAAREIIKDFLWQDPQEMFDAYEHLRPLLKKHTILIPSEWTGISPEELIGEIERLWGHRHLRTRLPRAAQLVAMGAAGPIADGQWEVKSQTSPFGEPYTVTATVQQGRTSWQCNCLDSNPACKHVLAVAMQNKLTGGNQ